MAEAFGLSTFVINQIQRVFAQHSRVEKAVIYGSRAKGNYKTGSDIDLTVFGALDLHELMMLNEELEQLPIPYQFDLSLYDRIENPDLVDHIDRVGKSFYEKEVSK
ncbi:MAG: nucleotidyltransferase domain-containing protein [bacterium]|nr:nucleotidyltransferase domain-containing protein [bacterium]